MSSNEKKLIHSTATTFIDDTYILNDWQDGDFSIETYTGESPLYWGRDRSEGLRQLAIDQMARIDISF